MEGGCWGFQLSPAPVALRALSLLLLFSHPLQSSGFSGPCVSLLPSRVWPQTTGSEWEQQHQHPWRAVNGSDPGSGKVPASRFPARVWLPWYWDISLLMELGDFCVSDAYGRCSPVVEARLKRRLKAGAMRNLLDNPGKG
ncbi:uncharacterized protein ACIBXB_004314 [Morphnus guianensis]